MKEIIAYCGLTCSECPAFIATQNDDAEELERVAEMWSKEYQSDIKPDDVVCEGCLPGQTRYCSHCSQCEIRACGIVRGVMNCAYCDDYGCDKLTGFFQSVPPAKEKLDSIRSGL
jgi:hypothetical protein